MRLFLSILISLFAFHNAFAHPLDISTSYVSLKGKGVYFTTFFHSYEVEYLYNKNGLSPKTLDDYYSNTQIVSDYIENNGIINNNGKKCLIEEVSYPEKGEVEFYSSGMEVNYWFKCDDEVSKLDFEIKYFTEFDLQTNKITFFDNRQGLNSKALSYRVLNSKIDNYSLDLDNHIVKKLKDTDGDKIPDEEEFIYQTDLNNPDTDGDNYSDYEEVTLGFDPLNSEMGPGQEHRSEPIVVTDDENRDISYDGYFVKTDNLLEGGFGMEYLNKGLGIISDYVKNGNGSFIYMFLFVVFLGFVHAVGPGHSKSLLTSYILDRDKGIGHGTIFALVFSFVHIVDIALLFLLTKLLSEYLNPYNLMGYIVKFSVIILIIISIYLLRKSLRSLKMPPGGMTLKKEKIKGGLFANIWMAFVAGLAPCTFGWSIFLILFALGESYLILPLLVALGIGIFLCLFIILVLVLFLRDRVYSYKSNLAVYSQLISSGLIFFISVYIGFKLFLT